MLSYQTMLKGVIRLVKTTKYWHVLYLLKHDKCTKNVPITSLDDVNDVRWRIASRIMAGLKLK